MTENNIIKFDPELKQPWLKRSSRIKRCKHPAITINDNTRILECKYCKAILDPIGVLMDIANNERVLFYSRQELKQTRQRIASLKDEEKRIKSRVRYAKKKDAQSCDVVDECAANKKLRSENFKLRRHFHAMNSELKKTQNPS